MESKKSPKEGCVWTDARCAQLAALEGLLSGLSMLNSSTNVIGNLQRVIKSAEDLRSWEIGGGKDGESFIHFLNRMAIKDRFEEEKKGDK